MGGEQTLLSVGTGVLVFAAVVLLPGWLVARLCGERHAWAAVSAVPVSFGVFGVTAWATGVVGVAFTPLTAGVGLAVACVVAAVTRRLIPDRTASRAWSRRRDAALPALGVIVGVAGPAAAALHWRAALRHGVATPDQGWDSQWHASAVRFILETGVASPTRMGQLQNIETGAQQFYPSAWHAAAALAADVTGADPVAATQLAAVVFPALVLPVSAAALAWRVAGSRGTSARIAASIAAAVSGWMPVLLWIGYFIGAWPYLTAMCAAGAVLAVFTRVPAQPRAGLPAALGLAGVCSLHPAPVTVIVLGVFSWWALAQLWRPTRPAVRVLGDGAAATAAVRSALAVRLRDLAVLVAPALGGALLVAPQILAGRSDTGEVAAYSTASGVPHTRALAQTVVMATRHTDAFPGFDPVVLVGLPLLGALVAVVRRRGLWALGLWAVSVVLHVHVLSPVPGAPGAVLSAVTNLHYNTTTRLIMPVGLLEVVLAAVGAGALVAALANGARAAARCGATGRARRVTGACAVVLAVLAGPAAGAAAAGRVADGARWAVVGERAGDRMVSEADLRAFEWLAARPEAADGLVAGLPADGHSWAYAWAGVHTLFRHYTWPDAPPGSASDYLAHRADLLGAGDRGDPDAANAVDEAARRLDVRFVISSPPNFWAFQTETAGLPGRLAAAPGLTPVFRDGAVVVYAVNQAFDDATIDRLRRESPTPLPAVAPGGHHRPLSAHRPGPGELLTPTPGRLGGRLDPDAVRAGLGPEVLELPV